MSWCAGCNVARTAVHRPILVSSLLLAACAMLLFQGCRGPARPAATAAGVAGASTSMATEPITPAQARAAWSQARAVLETRCVVCHGCYDAPCQLKLGSYEGIERGGSETKVYDASRLTEATPTRLFVDAHGASEWRKLGFHPVLPGDPPDPGASVLTRMLDLKRAHPLLTTTDVAKEFTLDLDRKQTCTDGEHFDRYAGDHPLWGMPYALPGLSEREHASLVDWVKAGAPHDDPAPLLPRAASAIEQWEAFLNDAPPKTRLAARYIFEHLFLASLYFEGTDEPAFFRLVRSRTPVGAVDEIATRRPFDDPKTERVYYRFVRRDERALAKTQMPYALSAARLKLYRQLFIEPDYRVDRLPTYEPDVASNPFRAFEAIPVRSRYRFMLDEAEFTMMGFIKGPVCRGQVALDVIQERFWITFVDPDAPWMSGEAAFLAAEATDKKDLDLPASGGSNAWPTLWLGYGKKHERYVKKRNEFLEGATRAGHGLSLASIWDGDGVNPSAGLTVYRHFDSATVVRGLVGGPPETAWVVDYPLIERIHYLLVAGFDVFGNVTHQISSRLYMDFLRMEGEAAFLSYLPPARRRELVDAWYHGVDGAGKARVDAELTSFSGSLDLRYRSATPEQELFALWKARLGKALPAGYDLSAIDDGAVRSALERLDRVKGRSASWLPETSFVAIGSGDNDVYASILRDSAHTNIAELFHENDRRVKEEDGLSVVRGFLGAYPNALFQVRRDELDAFVDAIAKLDGQPAYAALRSRFGVLRASEGFWAFSDRINGAYARQAPRESGLFDFNRLDAN